MNTPYLELMSLVAAAVAATMAFFALCTETYGFGL